MVLTTENFLNLTLENVINIELVSRLPQLGLDQCMLTAGCLFQTIWNHHEPYRVCRRPLFLRECPDEKSKIHP